MAPMNRFVSTKKSGVFLACGRGAVTGDTVHCFEGGHLRSYLVASIVHEPYEDRQRDLVLCGDGGIREPQRLWGDRAECVHAYRRDQLAVIARCESHSATARRELERTGALLEYERDEAIEKESVIA